MATKKKSKESRYNKPDAASVSNTCLMVIIALLIILIGLSVACITMIALGQQDAGAKEKKLKKIYIQRDENFEYEGWIDCMPPLNDDEADLCNRAKEAGYPYIAY